MMTYRVVYNEEYLKHHGIGGMKWGQRNGPPYPLKPSDHSAAEKRAAAKARSSGMSDDTKRKLKKAATAAVVVGSLAAAGYIYSKNKPAIDNAVKEGLTKLNVQAGTAAALMNAKTKPVVDKGKKYIGDLAKAEANRVVNDIKNAPKKIAEGAKEGLGEGLKESPKKAVKTALEGAALVALKKMLDETVGKEESAKIFQAANKKKVSSFWKVQPEDKDEEEDE